MTERDPEDRFANAAAARLALDDAVVQTLGPRRRGVPTSELRWSSDSSPREADTGVHDVPPPTSDGTLLSLLRGGARAGVVLQHVTGEPGARGASRATAIEAPPSPPPSPPRRDRLTIELDPDPEPPPAVATRSPASRSSRSVRGGRRLAYALAGLAGCAAAIAAGARWLGLFTLEVELDEDPDVVDCTVFAPPGAAPGDDILIQLFAHLPLRGADVRALAAEFDPAATRRAVRGLETEVARGTTLTFQLTMPGARVEEAVQSLVWRGRTTAVQFSAVVEEGGQPSLVGTVAVLQASVPIAHVKFTLAVRERRAPTEAACVPVGHDASRYRSAFLSYARQDDRHVLRSCFVAWTSTASRTCATSSPASSGNAGSMPRSNGATCSCCSGRAPRGSRSGCARRPRTRSRAARASTPTDRRSSRSSWSARPASRGPSSRTCISPIR
jgi:hypothetical protein